MIAHIAGVPLEELLPALAGGGLLVARTWMHMQLRRRRERRT